MIIKILLGSITEYIEAQMNKDEVCSSIMTYFTGDDCRLVEHEYGKVT